MEKAFTVKYKGLKTELKTKCEVCEAFVPNAGETNSPVLKDFVALWDTGATGTVITRNVAEQLGLKPVSKAKVFHVDGESYVNVYMIGIRIPPDVGFSSLRVTEGILTGIDVLIGMDIISQGDFSITNSGGLTTFSFQHPATHCIDFVEEMKENGHTPLIAEKVPGRNDLCHCGSGKKYKHCHGKK
ncbi:hypothetical protein Barb6_01489 [Bacteroidales bacterium Barb6]|nr:hypothetical protein Barb6_01489 [Bacteroidales bacterium Barb6]